MSFEQFEQLFRRATDIKLLLDVGDDDKRLRAVKQLEQALELAEQLPDPLPHVCAYRLAHLLLRDNDPDLERALCRFRLSGASAVATLSGLPS